MFQAGSTCYESAAAANAASGTAQTGTFVPFGGATAVIVFRGSTENTITYEYWPTDSSAYTTQTIGAIPPLCQQLTASDAVTVGWAIGAVWFGIYGITFLTRVMRSHLGQSNDT